LPACSEVENCEVGTRGCKGGAPLEGGGCKFDLVVRNGTCVEPGTGGDAGPGDDGGEPGCTCEDGVSLCTTDGECVNFCDVRDMLPGSLADGRPERVVCKQPQDETQLTFREVCVERCKARCQRIDWFCPDGDVCDEDECAADNAAMLTSCASDCGLAVDDVD